MLILTHSDELNRIYGEQSRSPYDNITNINNPGCDETRRNRASKTDYPSMRERPAPILMGSTSSSWQESPAVKETRATVISSRPSTITITSAVSTAGPLWFKNTRSYGKGRGSSEMHADKAVSNSVESFNQSDEAGSCRLAGLLRGNMQKRILLEDREEKKEGEEAVEGPSQFCPSLEEERARMSPELAASTGTTDLNPSATITAWEAGWNVTNAIQVRDLSNTSIFHSTYMFNLKDSYKGFFRLEV